MIKKILYSIIVIPVSMQSNFMDLKYKKLPKNEVIIEKSVSIVVKATASPLFYKFTEIKEHKEILISGEVIKKKGISGPKMSEDAYFQVGVIYEGDYRPGIFVRNFLPEWLLKVLSISEEYGVGQIDFFAISAKGIKLDKSDSIRDIKLNYKTVGHFRDDNTFKVSHKLKRAKILGLWLRADGDDTKAEFKTIIARLELN